jgi:hypothetical protein
VHGHLLTDCAQFHHPYHQFHQQLANTQKFLDGTDTPGAPEGWQAPNISSASHSVGDLGGLSRNFSSGSCSGLLDQSLEQGPKNPFYPDSVTYYSGQDLPHDTQKSFLCQNSQFCDANTSSANIQPGQDPSSTNIDHQVLETSEANTNLEGDFEMAENKDPSKSAEPIPDLVRAALWVRVAPISRSYRAPSADHR